MLIIGLTIHYTAIQLRAVHPDSPSMANVPKLAAVVALVIV